MITDPKEIIEWYQMIWNSGAAICWGDLDDGMNETNSNFFQTIHGTKVEQGKTYKVFIEHEDGSKGETDIVRITALRDNVVRYAKEGKRYSCLLEGFDVMKKQNWKRIFKK